MEEFVDAKNDRCFAMETVREVLRGMEKMEIEALCADNEALRDRVTTLAP